MAIKVNTLLVKNYKLILVIFISYFLTSFAHARGAKMGGGYGNMSFGFAVVNTSQDDMNRAIDTAGEDASAAPVSTKNMNGGYEFFGAYTYRMDRSMLAIQFRPSYFTQSVTGSGANGDYDYKLSGFTFFPMFRIVPLENDFISFYLQGGLGYGRLNGTIQAGPSSVSFSGGNFGAMFGLGAEFCFTENHCMSLEGNFRYLPIERNIASSASGAIPGLTNLGKDQEVENASGMDFQTTLSGVLGGISYVYYFDAF